jgi:hypothetical protein
VVWNPETNIRGPQGPKGDTGEKGDPGTSGSGSGNVNGPATTVVDDIVLWANTSGTGIKDSSKKISDLQPADATLTALAGLSATAGLVEQTGTDAFAKRPMGAANATDVLTRADGDARYITTTGFNEISDARVAAFLVAGSNITLTYSDPLNTLTIASTATGGGGGVPEPVDNSLYGRANNGGAGEWRRAVATAGDTMTGTLATSGVITSTNTTAAGSGVGSIATQGGISAAGAVKAFSKGNQLGVAGGTSAASVMPDTDANVLLYRGSADNWCGMGADNAGNMWFRAGAAAGLKPAFYIAASSTNVLFQSYIGGPQANFALPSGSTSGYAVAGSIAGSPAAQGGVHGHNGTQYAILAPPGKAGTFSGAVDIAGNLDINGTIDISSTSTLRNTATFMSTATFNTAVNGAATVSFPNIDATGNAGAANVVVIATSGRLLKSTSSLAYKTDIEPMWDEVADKLLNLTPIFYRSKIKQVEMEGKEHYSWYSFGAETVAAADPRFAAWGVAYQYDEYGEPIKDAGGKLLAATEETPQGVNWNALTAGLVNLVQRLEKRIAALEAQQGPAPS